MLAKLWMRALSLSLLSFVIPFLSGCQGVPSSSNSSGSNNGGGSGGSLACKVMSPGAGASLGGFVPFSTASLWNSDISAASIDPNSSNLISNWVGAVNLHPDFGTDPSYGIPYVIVNDTQSLVTLNPGAYSDESDPGPMPVPSNAPIEGGSSSNGDRHVIVLDNSNCFIYELYNASTNSNGSWDADSSAVWDMLSDGNTQRPYTWTSADAAGLPVFPGLVRYDEAASGKIQHAFRFTLPHTRAAFILPATHWAANTSDLSAPPMGMRLRLKSSYDISGFSANMQVILTAMKKYGLILADNGSSLFVTGASDSRWGSDLESLKSVPSSAFEVVRMSQIYTSANVPSGAAPVIGSFTATPTHVASGGSVTLTWSAANSQYAIVTPSLGAVRGTSVSVTPTATTTYTLNATNQFGRSTATVTVSVP